MVEEASEFDKADFIQANLRMRGDTPSYKQFALTFNPILRSNWIYDEFFSDKPAITEAKDAAIMQIKPVIENGTVIKDEPSRHSKFADRAILLQTPLTVDGEKRWAYTTIQYHFRTDDMHRHHVDVFQNREK